MSDVKPLPQKPAMVLATIIEFVFVAAAMLVFFTTGKIWLTVLLVIAGGSTIAFVLLRDRLDQKKRVG